MGVPLPLPPIGNYPRILNDTKIWAIPNITTSTDSRYLGAIETGKAFGNNDEWGTTIAHTDVIGIYGAVARETPTGTNGYLVNLVRMSNQYRKDIAIEVGGPLGTPGHNTGLKSANLEILAVDNIVALGGTVKYLRMDHPLQRVMDGLGLTLAEAVDQVIEYMQTIHLRYPDIEIGLVCQPTNWDYGIKDRYAVVPYGTDYDVAWDALIADIIAANEVLAFLHADISYEYQNAKVASDNKDHDHWNKRVAAWQADAVAASVPFGVTVNSAFGGGYLTGTFPGAPFAGSNELFQKYTNYFIEEIRDLEDRGVFTPLDHLIIQSFYYYPRKLAPHTEDFTFCDTVRKGKQIYITPTPGVG